jgi:hypothetical protein
MNSNNDDGIAYVCGYCDRPFASRGWRSRHERKAHPHDIDRTVTDSIRPMEHSDSDIIMSENSNLDNSDIRNRTEIYPDAGRPLRDVPELFEQYINLPFRPFNNIHEYKLAKFFVTKSSTKADIDEYFDEELCSADNRSFTSGHTLWKLLDRAISEDMPHIKEEIYKFNVINSNDTQFLYRDIIECVQYLLRQPAYTEHLVVAPIKEYNDEGERMYSEINTADWWWNTQVRYLHLEKADKGR